MKKSILILLTLALFAGWSCIREKQSGETKAPLIAKSIVKVQSDLMSPEVLWAFGRISEPLVSPDKKMILYGVSYYSLEQNKGNRELFVMDIDGKNCRQITHTAFSENQATALGDEPRWE